MNKNNLRFEWYNESEINWKVQNVIHQLLNKTFGLRTQSFRQKTYADVLPIKRLLCWEGEKLVGHTSIFNLSLLDFPNHKVAGIGMTCSIKPFCQLSYRLRKQAIQKCENMGYDLAIGRVKNKPSTKRSISDITADLLDIPVFGSAKKSHSWEILAVYSTCPANPKIIAFLDKLETDKKVLLNGEIF